MFYINFTSWIKFVSLEYFRVWRAIDTGYRIIDSGIPLYISHFMTSRSDSKWRLSFVCKHCMWAWHIYINLDLTKKLLAKLSQITHSYKQIFRSITSLLSYDIQWVSGVLTPSQQLRLSPRRDHVKASRKRNHKLFIKVCRLQRSCFQEIKNHFRFDSLTKVL